LMRFAEIDVGAGRHMVAIVLALVNYVN